MSVTRQVETVVNNLLCIVFFAGTKGAKPQPQEPISHHTPSGTAYCYPCTNISMHLGCLNYSNTCIKHIFCFLPRHMHMNFKLYQVNIDIQNKNLTVEGIFSPTRFFPFNLSGVKHHIKLFFLQRP